MKFTELLSIVGAEPLFDTGLLLAGDVDQRDVRRQLSRWTRDGRLLQLRRGVYALAPPYRKAEPHPFLVANRLVRASYVSRESVLGHYGFIPEAVPVTTSVTTSRPGTWSTPLGVYDYRHIRRDLLTGFARVEVATGQNAFVALPEKALLDMVYLRPGGDAPEYLEALRLQRLDRLDLDELRRLAEHSERAKLRRAADVIDQLALAEIAAFEPLERLE